MMYRSDVTSRKQIDSDRCQRNPSRVFEVAVAFQMFSMGSCAGKNNVFLCFVLWTRRKLKLRSFPIWAQRR